MGDMDPVDWDDIVAVTGPPAETIEAYVERMADDLRDEPPYDAVKAVHDALAEDPDADPGAPGQGEVFIVAYLLERRGVVDPGEGAGGGFRSVVDRRPDGERLRELFEERERTMWWLATQLGVHWSLVRYWLYEEDVPLRERNFPEETMTEIRAHREEA